MGKKRIIAKSEEEILKEGKKVEDNIQKEGKEISKKIREGNVYIASTYNNTIITLANPQGDVLGWKTAGGIGFQGSKKSTPFAASKVAEAITLIAKKYGIEKIAIFVKGVGSGRESAIRSFAARGLDISLIKDVTPIPHNGGRSRKARRV